MVRILESVQEKEDDPYYLLLCIGLSVFILFLMTAALCLCDRNYRLIGRLESYINSATINRSDEVYGEEMLRRQMEEEERKKEDPDVRRKRLRDYFHQNNLTVVIEDESYVVQKTGRSLSSHTDHTVLSASVSEESPDLDNDTSKDHHDGEDVCDDDKEKGEPEEIYLPSSSDGGSRKIPNCCAICLCSYDIGDVVVFSSSSLQEKCNHGDKGKKKKKKDNDTIANRYDDHVERFSSIGFRALFHRQNPANENDDTNNGNKIPGPCPHAFHHECILDYLQRQIGTPCPCCRREFTDLIPLHKMKEMAGIRARGGGRRRNGRNWMTYTAMRNGGVDGDGGEEPSIVGNDGYDIASAQENNDDDGGESGARNDVGSDLPDDEIV